MAKSLYQKAKLLRVLEILQEKTDDKHGLNTAQIIKELEKYDIVAERKSIYDDINILNDIGYDICKNKAIGGYFLASRRIDKSEILPLVDAVSSSKFITEKKSRDLIKKLEGLLSVYEASDLNRNVVVANRIKTDNESIFYAVDCLSEAITGKKQVSFLYCEWNVKKELVPRNNGEKYVVSPLALCWEDEKYYLIGFDETKKQIRHYRVDKIKDPSLLDASMSEESFNCGFDIVKYENKTFGMFGGVEKAVTISFPKELAGVVIDRFGKEPTIRKINDEMYSVRVKVAVSSQFFSWLLGLGEKFTLTGPEEVVIEFKDFVKKIMENYQ